jgi:hypothetical protein
MGTLGKMAKDQVGQTGKVGRPDRHLQMAEKDRCYMGGSYPARDGKPLFRTPFTGACYEALL